MTLFWTLCALLSLIALAILLWPVLRPERDGFARKAASLRDQLKVLELAVQDGLLTHEQAETRREALRSELLRAVDQPSSVQVTKRPLALVIGFALLLPLSALMLYRAFGTPNAVAFAPVQAARAEINGAPGHASEAAAANSGDAGEAAPDLRKAVEGLADRMKDKPDDVEGQLLLARTWRELAEFTKARDAYELVVAKRGDDPDILAEYAEAYGLAQEPRSLLGKPTELLDKVLSLSPTHQRALWLRGFAYRQSGDLNRALEVWDVVLKQLPPESEIATALIEQINVVRGELGQSPIPVAARAAPAGTGLPENDGRLDSPDSSAQAPSAPTQPAPPSAAASVGANVDAAPDASASADAAGAVRIRVELAPELQSQVGANDVLFVFARAEQGPPMPLAIQRLPARDFPVELSLSDANAMAQGMTLSTFERVKIGARISKSGQALAQSGDFQGFSAVFSQPTQDQIVVVIGERVP